MSKFKDLTGQRFGMLVALRFVGYGYWMCRCDCGKEARAHRSNLKCGDVTHCGNHRPMCRSDLMGQRFGKLVVVGWMADRKKSEWMCQCDCGVQCVVSASHLKTGHTKSCGCLAKEVASQRSTHGHTRQHQHSTEYRRWSAMKRRCLNRNCPQFIYYGARGITVCESWMSFENFLRDMGPVPHPDLTLERKDNNKGYSPDNCIWATRSAQAYNRRPKGTVLQ